MWKKALPAVILLAALALPAMAQQGNITTKKYRLADFPDKITKVVLPEDPVRKAALEEEILNWWSISPFEFCTREEYDAECTNDDYYFLSTAVGTHRRSGEILPSGILFLILEKGGEKVDEVVSVPLAPEDFGVGRELVFLGAILHSVQAFVLRAMESEKAAYQGISALNGEESYDRIFLSEDDLSDSLTPKDREKYLTDAVTVCPEDEADEVFLSGKEGAAVGYVVASSSPAKGDQCHTMLFTADTRMLVYYHKHTVFPKSGIGFQASDLRSVTGKL